MAQVVAAWYGILPYQAEKGNLPEGAIYLGCYGFGGEPPEFFFDKETGDFHLYLAGSSLWVENLEVIDHVGHGYYSRSTEEFFRLGDYPDPIGLARKCLKDRIEELVSKKEGLVQEIGWIETQISSFRISLDEVSNR